MSDEEFNSYDLPVGTNLSEMSSPDPDQFEKLANELLINESGYSQENLTPNDYDIWDTGHNGDDRGQGQGQNVMEVMKVTEQNKGQHIMEAEVYKLRSESSLGWLEQGQGQNDISEGSERKPDCHLGKYNQGVMKSDNSEGSEVRSKPRFGQGQSVMGCKSSMQWSDLRQESLGQGQSDTKSYGVDMLSKQRSDCDFGGQSYIAIGTVLEQRSKSRPGEQGQGQSGTKSDFVVQSQDNKDQMTPRSDEATKTPTITNKVRNDQMKCKGQKRKVRCRTDEVKSKLDDKEEKRREKKRKTSQRHRDKNKAELLALREDKIQHEQTKKENVDLVKKCKNFEGESSDIKKERDDLKIQAANLKKENVEMKKENDDLKRENVDLKIENAKLLNGYSFIRTY